MMYQVNIRSTKSGSLRNFEYWLDFQPSEITKIKAFVTDFNSLLEGKAVVTQIKAVIFEEDNFQMSDLDVVISSKVMYELSSGGLVNCIIPYLDPQKSQSQIEAFMMRHFAEFRKINNIMQHKKF